jgi:hypothetical protein
MAFGLAHQRGLQRSEQREQLVDLGAQPQSHIGGDLVVARAAGVQPLAGIARELGQAPFDVQVHVLERQLPGELAALDLAADLRQPALDRRQVVGAEHAHLRQHRRMGERAGNVRQGQALVEVHAGRVAQHELGHRLGKAAGPAGVLPV